MVKLLGIGILAQIVMCAVLGARLLWLARRTREVPELAFGISFLCMGALGYPLSIAARSGAAGDGTEGWLLAAALGAQNVAAIAIAVGTWRTFHPWRTWIGAAIAVAAVGFAASIVGPTLMPGAGGGVDRGAWYYLGFALRFGAHVWSWAVAARYAAAMQRRLVLGLADPVVADRMSKWAWTSGLICVGFAVFLAGRLSGVNVGESVPVLVATSIVSLASVGTMWLAFFPPKDYLERVAARGQ